MPCSPGQDVTVRWFLVCAIIANNDSLRLSTTKMIDPNAAKGSPSVPADPSQRTGGPVRQLTIIGIILITMAYTWFLTSHGVSYASGSDASGYFNSARLLSHGQTGSPLKTIDGLKSPAWNYSYQQPLGFVAHNDTGLLIPTYPVGLPLQLLYAAKLVGWSHAAILVNVISVLLIGWITAQFGRQFCGLRWPWLLTGIALLWASPLFVYFSLQPMSDVSATMWTLVALFSAARSRQHWPWAILTGTAVGVAVLVRPTNIFVLLPVMAFLGVNWRGWLAVITAGAPFAAVQAIYNFKVYGHWITSGYGDVSTLLQTKFVPPNIEHFALWIPRLLTPLVLLALGLPWFIRQKPRLVLAISIWVLSLIGFYAFYYHSGETWWYLRFILPVFPFLVLAAAMVAQRLTDYWSASFGRGALIAVMALFALNYLFNLNRKLDVTAIKSADKAYHDTNIWLQANVPANSIMAAMQASGALHYYADYSLVRYDLMSAKEFSMVVKVATANGQTIYAPLFPFEINRVVEAGLVGKWQKVAIIDYITIWKLQP